MDIYVSASFGCCRCLCRCCCRWWRCWCNFATNTGTHELANCWTTTLEDRVDRSIDRLVRKAWGQSSFSLGTIAITTRSHLWASFTLQQPAWLTNSRTGRADFSIHLMRLIKIDWFSSNKDWQHKAKTWVSDEPNNKARLALNGWKVERLDIDICE